MFPALVGADSSYEVLGGSMFPALKQGDFIFNKAVDPSTIEVGDILTVMPGGTRYTHRVFEKMEDGFILKGDANEDPDITLIKPSQIVGKVIFVVPFSFLETPYGFILLLWVPAVIIVGGQIHLIIKRRKREDSQMFNMTTFLLSIILVFSITRIVAPSFLGTSAYFSDSESASGTFQAGIWHIDATIDIDPDTLNLGSQGQWITVYVMIETEYEGVINVGTVILDDTVPAEWGEVQEDSRLMIKFVRTAVIDLIPEGEDKVTLTVSGSFMDGMKFSGWDTIRIVNNS
jgi:signal peptidase